MAEAFQQMLSSVKVFRKRDCFAASFQRDIQCAEEVFMVYKVLFMFYKIIACEWK
ncbi:MAG: hypothetical protein RHS_1654 [Robinsoniella sp. RHS]|nr:MAG: hypothetical protein RHS_1654 [Robinsoniella sp. RHS]